MIRTDCERVIMFVSKPMIRNAIELPRKAAICQNAVTASFDAGSMADRIVKLPKYNPATATAINPEAPIPVAKAYDPYTTATAKMVSATLSAIKLVRTSPRNATANPIKTHAPRMYPKLRAVCVTATFLRPTVERIIVNKTMPVASLNAASVSSNVDNLEGTLTRRKTSKTVTVSVGAISAAKRKETYGERPTSFHKI